MVALSRQHFPSFSANMERLFRLVAIFTKKKSCGRDLQG